MLASLYSISANGRVCRLRIPAQIPLESSMFVKLRATTQFILLIVIIISRTQTGLCSGPFSIHASLWSSVSGYSRNTRRLTVPKVRNPAVSAPGRNNQCFCNVGWECANCSCQLLLWGGEFVTSNLLEAQTGIEPIYTDLQSGA